MAQKKIIIVDDDLGIVESFTEILKYQGYLVDSATTARDGIKKMSKTFYDLALLDIKLPDKNGTEILKEIKENKPNMIKIMVTGFADLDNAVESLNHGANAYIMKPVNPEELMKLIRDKLLEKEKKEMLSEDKISEWIENRLNKLDEI
jgi:two-component system response regulator HydG